jgi:hypothetical protein
MDEDALRPIFENKIYCSKCGERTIDEVFLTELGQSQLTEATLDLEDDDFDDSNMSECQGCDTYLPVNDQCLCSDCSNKLERDLIRERSWDYSYICYGTDLSKRDKLRNDIIKKYGEKLELISPSIKDKNNNQNKFKKNRNKKRNR